MKIRIDTSQSKIGVNNLLMDDFHLKRLAVRLTFENDDNTVRSEYCLTEVEALEVVSKIHASLKEIEKAYQQIQL